MLGTFFFLSDFGLRKVVNEMDELFVFSVRAQENFETSSSKILRTTHGIFNFFEDSEDSTKMLKSFFFLSDFGLRKVTNEMNELFVFSVRVGVRPVSHH